MSGMRPASPLYCSPLIVLLYGRVSQERDEPQVASHAAELAPPLFELWHELVQHWAGVVMPDDSNLLALSRGVYYFVELVKPSFPVPEWSGFHAINFSNTFPYLRAPRTRPSRTLVPPVFGTW